MRQRQKGFALAAVLWLLAGLAIVVSLVNDAAVTSAERVRQLRERADFTRNSLAAKAQMIYYLSLAQPKAAGFALGNAMLLADETPYRTDALGVMRLQDLGGLINLNGFERPIMERFLQSCGVLPDQVPYLIDTLEDYTDADDLQRINGAERDTYILAGKPPPRNAPLLSVDELWAVHGWEGVQKTWAANGCARSLTVVSGASAMGSSLNLATAPPMILRAAGLDDAMASDISKARGDEQKVVDTTSAANAVTGGGGMFGMSGGMVRRDLYVTYEHSTMPWVIEYTFRLNLNSNDSPWSITQPVIRARSYTPVIPSANAVPWPLNSALPLPSSDANRVLPF